MGHQGTSAVESFPLRVAAKVTVMTYKALEQTLFPSASLTFGTRSFFARGAVLGIEG